MPYIIRPKLRYSHRIEDMMEFFHRVTSIHPNHITMGGAVRLARNGYKVLNKKNLRRVINRIHTDKT